MSLFQFKIPARQRKCVTCEARFQDNQKIYSTVHGDKEDPQRRDYCETCFVKEGMQPDIWGHWDTVLKKEKVRLNYDQKAMELFKEAHKGPDAQYLLFIAQYLKRKKQLVQRPEIKKEEMLFFEDPKTSEVYALAKTEIKPAKLTEFKVLFLEALERSE